MECLVHRKQEWRIGDVNPSIVGPRDQWRQYAWGNTERKALYCDNTTEAAVEPMLTPSVKEFVRIYDRKRRQLTIERDAKFTAVSQASCSVALLHTSDSFALLLQIASGKFHTLMLSGMICRCSYFNYRWMSDFADLRTCTESASVFALGDNSHGALGFPQSSDAADTLISMPTKVEATISRLKGSIQMMAASGYASFALVGSCCGISFFSFRIYRLESCFFLSM